MGEKMRKQGYFRGISQRWMINWAFASEDDPRLIKCDLLLLMIRFVIVINWIFGDIQSESERRKFAFAEI